MARWFHTTRDRLVNLDDFDRGFDVVPREETFRDGVGLATKLRWYVVGEYPIGDVRTPETLLGPYGTKEEAVKEGYACLLAHLEDRVRVLNGQRN